MSFPCYKISLLSPLSILTTCVTLVKTLFLCTMKWVSLGILENDFFLLRPSRVWRFEQGEGEISAQGKNTVYTHLEETKYGLCLLNNTAQRSSSLNLPLVRGKEIDLQKHYKI